MDEIVIDLLAEWDEQHRLGQPPTLEQFCPDESLRTELRRRIERRRHVGALLEAASEREEPPTESPGQLGPLRLLNVIGRGGMGTIYRAIHERLGREVVVKVIRSEHASDPQVRARFEREMTALGMIDNPRVVKALHADQADGILYMSMERVEGVDLGRLVRSLGPLPEAAACELARQAAEILAEVHRLGFVHRDLKPSNLMLTPGGSVVLLDLGLALPFGDAARAGDDEELTCPGQLLGTPLYMAPEQVVDAHRADPRSDLFALGAVLHKLLTGRAPAGRESPGPLPQVSPRLRALLEALLAGRPEGRPPSAEHVAVALTPFAAGHDLTSLLGFHGPPPIPKALPALPGRSRARARRLAASLTLAGLALVAGVSWGVAASRRNAEIEPGRRPGPRPRLADALPSGVIPGPKFASEWNGPDRTILANESILQRIVGGAMTHEIIGPGADHYLSVLEDDRLYPEGIIEATCRVSRGGGRGAWLLNLEQKEHHHGLLIALFGDGRVRLGPSWFDKTPEAGPPTSVVTHEAVGRVGHWNTVRVVIKGNAIRLFINGERVAGPVETGFLFHPAVVSLGVQRLGSSEGVQVQTRRLTFWPTTEMTELPPWPVEPADEPDSAEITPSYFEGWDTPRSWERTPHRFSIADGIYAIETDDPRIGPFWSWEVCDFADGIIEVTGRSAEGSRSGWVLNLGRLVGESGGTGRGAGFYVLPDGRMEVRTNMFDRDSSKQQLPVDPIRHPAILPAGGWNTLRVVVKSNMIHAFMNGQSVFGPVALSKPVTPGRIFLGLSGPGPSGHGRVEFDAFTVWPTTDIDRLPKAPFRGGIASMRGDH